MKFGQPFGSGQKAPNRGRADTNDDVVNIDGGAMDGGSERRGVSTQDTIHTQRFREAGGAAESMT